jgi:hypothetical protein
MHIAIVVNSRSHDNAITLIVPPFDITDSGILPIELDKGSMFFPSDLEA